MTMEIRTAGFAIYREAWRAAYRPEPLVTVSEWADRHRRLSSRASAEPGPWRTDRAPYLREIQDALSPSSAFQRVVVMKGSQLGFTEAGLNWLGFVIHHAPGPMMMVQPTTETGKRVSKQRVAPMIEESPALRALVRDPRSRDAGNTTTMKEFPGGVLVITGANSAVGLRSMPVRYLFLDEVDAYPADADGEGDPVELAERRTATFARRKMFMISTPKDAGASRIEAAYLESDQRELFVPCPHCGAFQKLDWSRLTWPEGEPDKAVHLCAHCDGVMENRDKVAMLANHEWRPSAPGDGRTAGFLISSLYSPVGWYSWGDAAAAWERAKGNPERERVFTNTVLGLPFADAREAPDWEAIAARAEDYPPGTVPMGGLLLVAGVDVQRDRLEAEVAAFGRDGESWSVDYRVIHGDPFQPEVWRDLDALLKERFPHAAGGALTIERLAIDSGDGMTTQAVYAWAGRYGLRRVMAIKGSARMNQVLGTAKPVETTGDGKVRRVTGVKVTMVGVNLLKARFYAHLRKVADPDTGEKPFGLCHFPQHGEEWFRMLTAESLVKTTGRNGFTTLEWVKTRPRNEALDCRVYAMAAALACGMERFNETHWTARERMAGTVSGREASETRASAEPAPSSSGEASATDRPPAPKPKPRTPFAPKKPAVIRSKWMTGG